MKHKVAELEGRLLDLAVATLEGWTAETFNDPAMRIVSEMEGGAKEPADMGYSTLWELAGPIIERERIGFDASHVATDRWYAAPTGCSPCCTGPTPLIAAMRAYVASKLGDEVELP